MCLLSSFSRAFCLLLLIADLAACFLFSGCGEVSSQNRIVRTPKQLIDAAAQSQAGDVIVLGNGEWVDAELVFIAQGTAEEPITLRAEEKGQVILKGQSNLSISGEYLIVEGLVFKEGYTPTSEVISFRTSRDELCNHCRVTECVIDHYTNPERFESDYWVGVYGRNNRFDHNYLVGKGNQGVTLAVRLNTEESRENNHRIDHNYFGYHQILGSNGGETLRIGTSHYALESSNTLVENNFFDRCNGEHEIISNKSCQNVFRDNTFYECQGTLTMRHGNETLVENNYFFGNNRPNTGGIRIINEKQSVVGNYGEGLTGHRFRGALVIMNGVPNSPPNRYMPVIESAATQNVFVNCDHIQLCAGADEERSSPPTTTTVSGNVFLHPNKENIFTVYDDISGISFAENILGPGMQGLGETGFRNENLELEEVDGVQIPLGTDAGELIRAGLSNRAKAENTGVHWYPNVDGEIHFDTGKRIEVLPGLNSLLEAVEQASGGDVLVLTETADYVMSKSIDLHVPITVIAAEGLVDKPCLKFQKTSLFNIENGGALSLSGVRVSGEECRDKPRNTVIRTSRYSMNKNYKLFIEDCEFENLDINHSFNVLTVYRNTFADSVVLRNSVFRDISGMVLPLNQETDDIGIYNAEQVVIENCGFENIGGAVLDLHRGGRDESTFGPMLELSHSSFRNVGHDRRNRAEAAIGLHGVQVARISNSTFEQSRAIDLFLVVGEPIVQLNHLNFDRTREVITDNGEPYEVSNLSYLNNQAEINQLRGSDGQVLGASINSDR